MIILVKRVVFCHASYSALENHVAEQISNVPVHPPCLEWTNHPHLPVQAISINSHNSLNPQWIIVIDITGRLSVKELSRFTLDHPTERHEERGIDDIDHL